MRVDLQPGYILHTRPYRDSSLLVDCLSRDFGRLTLVAKGARQNKKNRAQLLQPFSPLLLSWQGKSSLKTLVNIEAENISPTLSGHYLYSAFYANELLVYLLPEYDSVTDIYDLYQRFLSSLKREFPLERTLRHFELSLLSMLGYGIDFEHEAVHGNAIDKDKRYQFIFEVGFVESDSASVDVQSYGGGELLLIAGGDYTSETVRKAAKQITRTALGCLLPGKTIKSRELFVSYSAPRHQK